MKRVKFFLLAGGYGKRTRPLSFIKPKPLFPLQGTPLIKILLKQLKEHGLKDGFINLHYLPDTIRQCIDNSTPHSDFPNIHFFYEEALSGSRIIRNAAEFMEDHQLLLITNGDIFLDIPFQILFDELLKDDADGTLLVRTNDEMDPQYKIILNSGNLFAGREIFSGNDPSILKNSYMYTGVGLFKRRVIHSMSETNFFDMLEHSQFKIKLLKYTGIWLDIGDPSSYFHSNRAYKNHCAEKNINSFSQNVFVSKDSTVNNCIIWENTQITNQSVLSNCIITGNIHLKNVEHHNQIIMTDAYGKIQLQPLYI